MERERLDAEAVIVGGGPAGLACALRLARLVAEHNAQGKTPGIDPEGIFVLEKAAELGMHSLSGAVMDPRALAELEPDYIAEGAPLECPVTEDHLYYLDATRSHRLPFMPAALRNEGNHIISLGRLVQWLGGRAEAAGVNVFPGTAAVDLLVEDGRVCGVITDDKGLDKAGEPQANFEPGYELRAKVTVCAEGARGSLSGQLIKHFHLDSDSNPQAYALGLKEVWEIPAGRVKAGTVWHSFGHPLSGTLQGGGWMYALSETRLSLGLVVGLHYADPAFQPHTALQRYKRHPLLAGLLEGGSLLRYGAKTLAKGGYWALPRLSAPGALLVGDAAGFLDAMRLKGVHMAIKSGMLAAEAAYAALCAADEAGTDQALAGYRQSFEASWMKTELWRGRNYHQAFQHGTARGLAASLVQGFRGRQGNRPAHAYLRPGTAAPAAFGPDGKLTQDRLTSVYHSGTGHREDQPVHLKVVNADQCQQCHGEFGSPCQHFCPAGVYEWEAADGGPGRLRINAANCLHCKTCDIMDPYQNIAWTPPEGGGGPQYEGM